MAGDVGDGLGETRRWKLGPSSKPTVRSRTMPGSESPKRAILLIALSVSLTACGAGAAKELGLEGERAQKFLDSLASIDAARAKQLDEAFVAQDAKWAAELKADPEIGGEKFDAAMKDVRRALTRFGGTPEQGQTVSPLAALLHQAGLGNNRVVLKAFAAIGRALADDSINGTAKPAPAAGERKSDAELFYGTPTAAAPKEQ